MRKSAAIIVAGFVAMTGSAFALDGGDPVKGEQNFKKCAVCHKIGPDAKNAVGPELNGVVGRQIGAVEGYAYGAATKAKGADGTVWTEDLIFEYLPDPKAFVGGTSKMVMKFPDDQFRKDVIAYIAQFNADGTKK